MPVRRKSVTKRKSVRRKSVKRKSVSKHKNNTKRKSVRRKSVKRKSVSKRKSVNKTIKNWVCKPIPPRKITQMFESPGKEIKKWRCKENPTKKRIDPSRRIKSLDRTKSLAKKQNQHYMSLEDGYMLVPKTVHLIRVNDKYLPKNYVKKGY